MAHLVNGLLSGSLYVLAAVATTFLLLIAGFIQFAHGEVITIAMYVAWLVLTKTNDHLFLGVSAAIVIAILTTIVMEPLIRRLRQRKSVFECLIFTVAFGMILTEIMSHTFNHGMPVRFPKVLTGSDQTFEFGVIVLSLGGIFVVLGGILVLIIFSYFLYHTKQGMALRAIAQDIDTAQVMGVPITRVTLIGFAITGLLAGITAVLFSMTLGFVSPSLGNTLSFRALAVMLFAGLGNLKGAVFCGLLLGIIESLTTGYFMGAWTDAVAMGIIMLTIMLRPNGFWGQNLDS